MNWDFGHGDPVEADWQADRVRRGAGIGAIAANMPGMHHVEPLVQRRDARRRGAVEKDGQCAAEALRHRGDVADKPRCGLGPVAPPAARRDPVRLLPCTTTVRVIT